MKQFATLTNLSLAFLIIALSSFGLYQLRTAFYKFDTVEINIQQRGNNQISDALIDKVLLDNIGAFSYIHSFDHIFQESQRDFQMSTLWIDRCEVRQKDFYTFEKWEKLHQPSDIAHPEQPPAWSYYSASAAHKISGRLEAPANGVSYYDAYAYCRAAGGRLPDYQEWLAIAGGKENRLYPWGNKFNLAGWPYLDPRLNGAQRCGLHQATDTPEQIHDLGSIASEWAQGTNDDPRPRILGGNAFNRPFEIYSLSGFYRIISPEYRSPYLSFRCVYDDKPAPIPWIQESPKTVRLSANNYQIGLPSTAKVPGLLASGLSRKQLYIIKNLLDKKYIKNNFYILRHEVTREQYRRFLNDPLVRLGIYADAKEPKEHNYEPYWINDKTNEQLPATDIDWWSAYAFARWAGGRLPSSHEWIIAASMGNNSYPWGNKYKKKYAITADYQLTEPQPALQQNRDITAAGVINMGGNVSEWTQSLAPSGDSFAMIVKGGNYVLPGKETARIDFRNLVPASLRSPYIGFRIVFDDVL